MTPAELFQTAEVFTLEQAAQILQLRHRSGKHKDEPDPRLVRELVHRGKLILVDPDQPPKRWTVSRNVLQAYMTGTPIAAHRLGASGVSAAGLG